MSSYQHFKEPFISLTWLRTYWLWTHSGLDFKMPLSSVIVFVPKVHVLLSIVRIVPRLYLSRLSATKVVKRIEFTKFILLYIS